MTNKNGLEILELFYLSLIAALTLTGNCLVILAFVFGPRSIRTYTNYFVVNLAVSDLMVGCLSLPFWMVYRADKPLIANSDVYKYFIAIDILCGTASILSLAAISLERMFAVKFPTTHFNLNSTPVLCGIVGTWTFGIIFTGSKFAVKTNEQNRIYTATIFTLAFVVPLVVIMMSYCIIFFAALKMMTATNQPGNLARELHVAKTISVIIALFIFCWMPFFIINMLFTFCGDFCKEIRIHKWIIYVTKMMHYSNSMMNFFVYAVRSPDFKRTFKALVLNCDTKAFRQRVRTFSESIVTRSRTHSERLSFIHDNNCNNINVESTGTSPSLQHLRLIKSRLHFKQSRLSSHSNCTEVSTIDETWSPSTNASSSTNSSNPLLDSNGHACVIDDYNNEHIGNEEHVSSI